MNQQREKTCSREKKRFSWGFGFLANFRGGLIKKCGAGRVDQHSFLVGIALCSGEVFSGGGS